MKFYEYFRKNQAYLKAVYNPVMVMKTQEQESLTRMPGMLVKMMTHLGLEGTAS